MRLKPVLYFLMLCSSLAGYAQAGAAPLGKHKPYLTLLESYSQQTISGRRVGARPTSTHFIIVWKGSRFPEFFFWRGDGGFAACTIMRAHKVIAKPRNFPKRIDYTIEEISTKDIHKGDTLELTPGINGQLPVEIPQRSINTLFFKTGSNNWLSFPVKNIAKKHAITMP